MTILLCIVVGAAVGGLTGYLMIRPRVRFQRQVTALRLQAAVARLEPLRKDKPVECPICVETYRRSKPHPCDSIPA